MLAAAPQDPPDAAPWVTALKHGSYDSLNLAQRLEALAWLCGVVCEGLGVRNLLESREREAAALKKQLLEDARVRGWREGGQAQQTADRGNVVFGVYSPGEGLHG